MSERGHRENIYRSTEKKDQSPIKANHGRNDNDSFRHSRKRYRENSDSNHHDHYHTDNTSRYEDSKKRKYNRGSNERSRNHQRISKEPESSTYKDQNGDSFVKDRRKRNDYQEHMNNDHRRRKISKQRSRSSSKRHGRNGNSRSFSNEKNIEGNRRTYMDQKRYGGYNDSYQDYSKNSYSSKRRRPYNRDANKYFKKSRSTSRERRDMYREDYQPNSNITHTRNRIHESDNNHHLHHNSDFSDYPNRYNTYNDSRRHLKHSDYRNQNNYNSHHKNHHYVTQSHRYCDPNYRYEDSHNRNRRYRSYDRIPNESEDHRKRNGNYDDENGHYVYHIGERIHDRYEILKFMGEGTFARVVECYDIENKMNVAVKIVRSIEKYTDAAKIEIDFLRDLKKKDSKDDKNCIRFIKSLMYRGHICIIFPKYGLSLFDFIKQNRYKGFDIDHVQEISYNIIKAIEFLHSIELIHTDLKPENILMESSSYENQKRGRRTIRVPKNTSVRVIDFGSATYDYQHHTSIISTRHYRAPEVILGLGWSFPADMWSVGCILIELYTGEALFQTHENREHLAMMEKVLNRSFPKEFAKKCNKHSQKYFDKDENLDWPNIASSRSSVEFVANLKTLKTQCNPHSNLSNPQIYEQFLDLIDNLLLFDVKKRLSAKEAKNHPFFNSLKQKSKSIQSTSSTSPPK